MGMYLNPAAYSQQSTPANGNQATIAPSPRVNTVDPYASSLSLSSLMLQTPGYLTQGPRGKLAHSALPRKQGGKQGVYDESLQHWIDSGAPLPAPTPQVAKPQPQVIRQPIQQQPSPQPLPTPSRSPHAAVNQQQPAKPSIVPGQQLQSPVQNAIENHQQQQVAAPSAQSFDIATLTALLTQLGMLPPQQQQQPAPQPQTVPTLPHAAAVSSIVETMGRSGMGQQTANAVIDAINATQQPAPQPSPQEQSAARQIATNATPSRTLAGKGTEIKLKDDNGQVVPWIRDRFIQRMDGVVLNLTLTATLPNGEIVSVPLENGGAAMVRTFDSGGAGFYVGGKSNLRDAAGDVWKMQVGCNISAVKYVGRQG